jgi:hypothetical protein
MDVEKTMEFILEQLAQVAVLQAKAEERQAKAEARQDRTDRRLSRAIRLAVEEARRERARRRELEERTEKARRELDERVERSRAEMEEALTRLAAAQLVTEEKLQRFLESRSGLNGSGGSTGKG